jgi:hypothetical protein
MVSSARRPYETVFGAGPTLGPVDANWSWDVSSDTNVIYRIGVVGSGQ